MQAQYNKKEKEENGMNEESKQPEIYTGNVTGKKKTNLFPVIIMFPCFLIAILMGMQMTYQQKFVGKGNYFYQIDNAGKITMNDGAIFLILMLLAMVCCIFHLYLCALGIETIAAVLAGWLIWAGVSNQMNLAWQFVFMMIGVFVSELSVVIAVVCNRVKSKERKVQ